MGLTTFTSFHAPHVALTDLDFFTENFQRKKKNQLWGLEPTVIPVLSWGPVQLPLGYQGTKPPL